MGGGSSSTAFRASCANFFQGASGKAAFISYIEGGKWKILFQNRDGMESLIKSLSEDEMLKVLHPQSWSDDPELEKDIIPSRNALLAVVFPRFLASSYYESWVDQIIKESSIVVTGEEKDTNTYDPQSGRQIEKEKVVVDVGTRDERLDAIFSAREITLENVLSQALASIDREELGHVLESAGEWMAELITAVEYLPFCISIATAREDRRNFPLIYVNKAFEKASGYTREEVVGKNCKFLQGPETEKESIERLVQALSSAQPCKVALSNRTKQGDIFTNLLALKPVFAEDGVYSYVIGVQYVTSSAPILSREKDILLVEDLLSILPNMLKKY